MPKKPKDINPENIIAEAIHTIFLSQDPKFIEKTDQNQAVNFAGSQINHDQIILISKIFGAAAIKLMQRQKEITQAELANAVQDKSFFVLHHNHTPEHHMMN